MCNYIPTYWMSVSRKAEAVSRWFTRNIVGTAQTRIEWINMVLFLVLQGEKFTDRPCLGHLVSLGIFIQFLQIFTECHYVSGAGVIRIRKLLVTKWIPEFSTAILLSCLGHKVRDWRKLSQEVYIPGGNKEPSEGGMGNEGFLSTLRQVSTHLPVSWSVW